MAGVLGVRGQGDGELLQWSVGGITALAQKVGKRYAALAVSSTEPCSAAGVSPSPDEPAPVPAASPGAPDFEVVGSISHERADATWVDDMGVVANRTSTSYRVATFDLGLFAADGSLICVDIVSVNILKAAQERAFRDAIRCPGYAADAVAEIRLQFSGGI